MLSIKNKNNEKTEREKKAEALYISGEIKAAYQIYSDLIKAYPEDFNLLVMIANTSPYKAEAEQAVQRAATINPNNPYLKKTTQYISNKIDWQTEGKFDNLNQEILMLDFTLHGLRSEVWKYEGNRNKLKEEIQTLEAQLSKLNLSTKNKELDKLQKEQQELEHTYKQRTTELQKLEADLTKKNNELERATTEYNLIALQTHETTSARDTLRKDCQELEAQREKLKKELESLERKNAAPRVQEQANKIKELDVILTQRQSNLEQLNQEKDFASSKLETLNKECAKLETDKTYHLKILGLDYKEAQLALKFKALARCVMILANGAISSDLVKRL